MTVLLPIDLGVNIDHVATLRQQRCVGYPDPIRAALLAEQSGADAITLHLREDRRHIQDDDVIKLRQVLQSRMNLECAITAEMLDFAIHVRPHDVCLVPERRAELTTEGGLDVLANLPEITTAVERLHAVDIRVSLFIAPELAQIDAAMKAGARVIELHTGQYADAIDMGSKMQQLERIRCAARYAAERGIKVNAGHGLHYDDVQPIAAISDITELNIGYAIVAEALFRGWQSAVTDMRALIDTARIDSMTMGLTSL